MEYQKFYQTIVKSPQWQLWVEENETNPQYDVHESMEIGALSPKHFQAFLEFVKNMDSLT